MILTPEQADQVARLVSAKHPYIDIRRYEPGLNGFDTDEWLELAQDFADAIDQVTDPTTPCPGTPRPCDHVPD